ncbi:cytosine permease, partial [Cronobacter sakazakii]
LPRFNYAGLAAYSLGALTAYFSPWVAPLVGIAVSAASYLLFVRLARGREQRRALAQPQP